MVSRTEVVLSSKSMNVALSEPKKYKMVTQLRLKEDINFRNINRRFIGLFDEIKQIEIADITIDDTQRGFLSWTPGSMDFSFRYSSIQDLAIKEKEMLKNKLSQNPGLCEQIQTTVAWTINPQPDE